MSTTVAMVTGVVLETPAAIATTVHTVKIAAAFKVDVVINVGDTTTTGADGGAMLVVVGIESGMREEMPKYTGVSICETFSFGVQDSTSSTRHMRGNTGTEGTSVTRTP